MQLGALKNRLLSRLSGGDAASRRLHLGCFDRPQPGWLNTDVTPHLWLARSPWLPGWLLDRLGSVRAAQHRDGIFGAVSYLDLREPFPFSSARFDAIFTCHVLEHLYADEAEACLRECARVLAPGGVLRIVVPDLDRIVGAYDRSTPERFLGEIFEVSSARRAKNEHHWHYNASSLVRLLTSIGFSAAGACEYRRGACPDLDLLDNRPDESLYVEARR